MNIEEDEDDGDKNQNDESMLNVLNASNGAGNDMTQEVGMLRFETLLGLSVACGQARKK